MSIIIHLKGFIKTLLCASTDPTNIRETKSHTTGCVCVGGRKDCLKKRHVNKKLNRKRGMKYSKTGGTKQRGGRT